MPNKILKTAEEENNLIINKLKKEQIKLQSITDIEKRFKIMKKIQELNNILDKYN